MRPILYQLLPHRCPLCLSRSDRYLCQGCLADLPVTNIACRICALPLPHEQAICGDCLAHPKPFVLTVCPLLYGYPLDRLITQFKERQPRIIGTALLPHLLSAVAQVYPHQCPWPDVLVPVPSHWRARLRRGFNQAHGLADLLSGELNIPVQPWVTRRGGVQQQKNLDRKNRFNNLRDAFTCNRVLQGERVAVVDDVITTGATAIRLSECLLKAGASEVHIWALARTPKPSS